MRHFAFLLCLLPSIALAQATAVITGPETASPGDLIILDASESDCDSRQWLLVGSDKSFLQFEEGRKCVFASGVSGRYHFVLATAKCEDSAASLATSTHTITIGTPGPEPAPQPKPDPPPGPELSAIARQVRDLVATLDRRSGEAQSIAAELEKIAHGSGAKTPTQIAAECKAIAVFQNPEAQPRWKAFSDLFASIMSQNQNHIQFALTQIAVGIRAAEKPASAATSDPANETIRSMLDKLRGDLRGIAQEVGQ